MYQIKPLKNRPDPALVEELAEFGVAQIADSMGRYGAMKPYIRPVTTGQKLAGPALTIQTYRSDNLMVHVGLEMAQAGDILVVDAGEVTNAGLWGDLMTTMAVKKKLGGIVTDGAIRDVAEIIQKGFPAYAKSISPLGGFKDKGGAVNVPVSCGGLVVQPGDIIVGDDDGVAVIPLGEAEEILLACRRTRDKEEAIARKIEEGQTLFHLLGLPAELERLGLQMPESKL